MTRALSTASHSHVVIPFDLGKRQERVATEATVHAALAEFSRLADQLNCRWVSLHGIASDGRHFHVASHDSCSGGLGLDASISKVQK